MVTRDFIEKLKKFEGSNVYIEIKNKLYGNQKVKCALRLIDDEERLGFIVQNGLIYIYKDNIGNFGIIDNIYYFADDIMCVSINKI